MNKDIEYIAYTDQYRSSLLALLGHIWTDLSIDEIDKKFAWRYENNYCLRENTTFIAVKDGIVIGFRGFAAVNYFFNGLRRTVLIPCDAIVDPGYRREGVFSALTEMSLRTLSEKYDQLGLSVYLNLSSNEKSTPGNIKIGWRVFSPKCYYTKICLGNILSLIKHHNREENCGTYGNKEYCITIDTAIDLSILRQIKHYVKYPITRDRSDEYYQWRYVDSLGKFLFAVLKEQGRPSAYLILEKVNTAHYSILDYAANSQHALYKAFKLASRSLKIIVYRLFIVGGADEEIKSLMRNGFFKESSFVARLRRKKKYPALMKDVRLIEGDGKINNIELMNPTNWRLLKGDSH
ncbi:MAG: hypothetical protein QM235_14665 [Pseudomonadota bacterium]|jgi:hypothetical protein|nr:hypothetical protein [Pseudomonadota bacterium]